MRPLLGEVVGVLERHDEPGRVDGHLELHLVGPDAQQGASRGMRVAIAITRATMQQLVLAGTAGRA